MAHSIQYPVLAYCPQNKGSSMRVSNVSTADCICASSTSHVWVISSFRHKPRHSGGGKSLGSSRAIYTSVRTVARIGMAYGSFQYAVRCSQDKKRVRHSGRPPSSYSTASAV